MPHTLITLATRLHDALVSAGLDPVNVTTTFTIRGDYVYVGCDGGDQDFTKEQASDLARAFGGVADGPPGNGFLHRRTADGIGFTVGHAKGIGVAA